MKSSIKKFGLFVIGCFLIYALYLTYLQLWKGPALARNSMDPRLWIMENRVERGGIYAREGEKLAESLRIEKQIRRRYLYGPLYAHIIGYKSRRLGKIGLEKAFDRYLLGLEGRLLESLLVRWGLGQHEGGDLYLTIDHKIQEKAWNLLAPVHGAAVVLNPQTGEILTLVSTPSFDPNPENLEKTWDLIRKRPDCPLLNKATMGLYPPGSTLKIVTAAIGCKAFSRLNSESFLCRGELRIQGRRLQDLREHGWVDLRRALAVSCNCYFGSLGLDLGAARFSSGLQDFGWGEKIPFDLPVTFIPLPEKSFATPNGLAEAAIGQGKVVASPLFMALVVGSLGNGGIMMRPYLVREIRSPQKDIIWKARPQVLRRTVTPEVAAQVREAMIEVVRNGTGTAASLPSIQVAGKTGSAENPEGVPHAWFVAFAPAHRPRVAVSVLVEHGGEGGKAAALIARELIKLALARGGT